MKEIAYLALIILLLAVIRSDYNDTANRTYSLLTRPIVLYYENSVLGFNVVTVEDNAGHRVSMSAFSALSNRISNEYNVGDTVDIKPAYDYSYVK